MPSGLKKSSSYHSNDFGLSKRFSVNDNVVGHQELYRIWLIYVLGYIINPIVAGGTKGNAKSMQGDELTSITVGRILNAYTSVLSVKNLFFGGRNYGEVVVAYLRF